MKSFLLTTLMAVNCLTAQESSFPKKKIERSSLPRYTPEEAKTAKVLFSGDLLYWVPEMEGLIYANETVMIESQKYNSKKEVVETVESPESRPFQVQGNWRPGVRVSAGYLFDEKGWDTIINWSYFKNDPSHRAHQASNNTKITPSTLVPDTFIATNINEARGKWYLIQNTVELEVGRNFPVGNKFLARPFVGLAGTNIRNKNVFHYSVDTPIYSGSIEVPMKSNFLGLGPRIGGSLSHEFGKGIGIFALTSGSVMLGKFENSFNRASHSPGSLHTITTMQIQMGWQWKQNYKDKYFFGLRAAWEQNFYSGVNRSVRQIAKLQKTPTYRESGDLILKGLTASCHLDF